MIKKLKAFVNQVASHDAASWVSHFVICVVITTIAALIGGTFWGYVSSEILLVYFALREGLNYGNFHCEYSHGYYTELAKKKKLKDGILDFAGPLVCHLTWWYAILA